jgi:hypothetical protein
MIENDTLDPNFYNDSIKKSIKDLKIRLNDYQFGKWSNWPESIRQDNIRTIKAQLWEWGVSKRELENI